MVDFEQAIGRVLGHEGGYVNDPRDSGGETKWGISKRSYPDLNIATLSRPEAIAIYKRDFWDPLDNLVSDDALTYQLLDAAVNHGIGNAVRMLQRAVSVADDGHFGEYSRAALGRMDRHDVHLLFLAERFDFWAKLVRFDAFGRGWVRRGAENLRLLAKDN